MLKKLAWTAPIIILSASLALAQGAANNQPPSGAKPMQETSLSGPQWLASDIYKADVYDDSQQKIGEIKDLVIDKNLGAISTAVIGIGGFLGIGEKDAGIPFKDLKVASGDGKNWLVLNKTKDELQAAPTYVPKERMSGRSTTAPSQALSTSNWLVSDIYKADVYDNSDQKIGQIIDLAMDSSGKISNVAVKVADSGKKEVAVPFNELKVVSPDGKNRLVLDKTKDDLMKEPVFEKPEQKKT
jgi:sporulation protein YlmC with PRC-barrel domain